MRWPAIAARGAGRGSVPSLSRDQVTKNHHQRSNTTTLFGTCTPIHTRGGQTALSFVNYRPFNYIVLYTCVMVECYMCYRSCGRMVTGVGYKTETDNSSSKTAGRHAT